MRNGLRAHNNHPCCKFYDKDQFDADGVRVYEKCDAKDIRNTAQFKNPDGHCATKEL